MTPDSNTAGSFHLSRCWTEKGSYLIFLLFLLLPLTPALPCVAEEHFLSYAGGAHDNLDSGGGCGSCDDATSTDYGTRRSSLGCTGLLQRCDASESFCFLSTLVDGEENCKKSYLRSSGNSNGPSLLPSHAMVHKFSNGREVTCSSLGTESALIDGLPAKAFNANSGDAGMCKGALAPVGWIIKSSLGATRHSANSVKIDGLAVSSSFHVTVDPPFLDWGRVDLYSPSVSFLTVTNSHNDSILHLYEPFSTDSQFFVQSFRELSLAPGETATVAIVFLPKQLGTLAAHLVLQTSFGGFIVNAKGLAVDSPFRVQLGTEVNASRAGGLIKNLSLYNPYNKSLLIEEVTVWFSLASGNVSHTSHISCLINDLSHDSSDIPIDSIDSDKDTVERNRHGMSWVGLRPHNKWELSPDETETVLKVTILPYFEGKGVGAVCVRLHESSQSKTEVFVIPIEEEVKKKVGFHSLTNSVSAFLDPLDLCGDGGSTFLLSLRNDVSELLQLVKIVEVTENEKLFHIRYTEDLLLYPGSLTHVALVTHALPSELESMPSSVPQQNINCKLQIMTNDSTNPQIDIPCQALSHSCARQDNEFHPAVSIDPQLDSSTKSTEIKAMSSDSSIEKDFQLKSHLFDILEAHELILGNWKSQSTVTGMSLLKDPELTFSTVEVGSYAQKWITLKNPSERPIVAQLILISGVVDHCKSLVGMSCHFFSKLSPRSPMVLTEGFSLSETSVIGASIPPLGSSTLGPILFHPSDRCMWRGSALIRNNLSGVEWLPLQGIGRSKSLVLLEESQPVQKLEFNLDWSLPLNNLSVEPKLGKDVSSSACSNVVSKELILRNTGELPFEVVKLQVSGNSCELDGFKIHTCKGFVLEPGESMMLHISYQPDFSDDVVHRDLELALALGKIVIPMKVNIPIYMIKLCRRTFVWSFLRILFLITFVGFAITAVLLGLPHVMSVFYGSPIMRSNMNTIIPNSQVVKPAKVHRNPQNSRSNRDDVKSSERYVGRSPDGKISSQDRNAGIQFEKDLSCEERVPIISHQLQEKSTEEASKRGNSDNFQSSNLTVKIVKEKGKRKKRRPSGVGAAGLAAKNEVSSSQSGNSTPSSPLSPNAFTPKKVWPSSSEPIEISTSRNISERNVLERSENEVKNRVPGSFAKTIAKPAAIKCEQDAWQKANSERVLHQRPSPKPVLTPSATFPSSSWRAPGIAATFHTSASPIAPHARAPGSNLNRDKPVKRDEVTLERKDFTYDIWGNHLCDHIMGRSKDKELSPRALADASEGDSLSFFARGPQSLVKMSSLRSESPDPRSPSFGVNYNHQMV